MTYAGEAEYLEVHVPLARTEQEFLRHAVVAAVKKFRERIPVDTKTDVGPDDRHLPTTSIAS